MSFYNVLPVHGDVSCTYLFEARFAKEPIVPGNARLACSAPRHTNEHKLSGRHNSGTFGMAKPL